MTTLHHLLPVARPAAITEADWHFALTLCARLAQPPPDIEPDEFAEKYWRFAEKEIKGRFNFTGRNYLRRPMRDSVSRVVRKLTLVFGRGTGKTSVNQISAGFRIKYIAGSGLWLFPSTNGAGGSREFVKTRFLPNIKATELIAALIPAGQERFNLNKQFVDINGAHFAFVGSNSAGQVVGGRHSFIVMDEKEKYPESIGAEAGTSDLVTGSTEGVAEYLIINTSTPSIDTGLIWKDLLQSDFRVNFLPCPHCNGDTHGTTEEAREAEARGKKFSGWFILAWSEQFAAGLPVKFTQTDPTLHGQPIPMAFVKWPKDCRRRDGSWDTDRVLRETWVECPHCHGHIRDITLSADHRIGLAPATKNWMDAHSFWLATKDGEPKHHGYQQSNLYAPVINEESTWGARAVKFLNDCDAGGESIRNHINAVLGLAEVGQAHANRITLGETPLAQSDWIPILTADFQKNHPFLWFVVRKWCAFKLHPPGGLTDGVPDFVKVLDKPGNEVEKKICHALAGPKPTDPVWNAIGELLRFEDPRSSPIIEFLIAQKITGLKLQEKFREGNGLTMDFRRVLYREFSIAVHGKPDAVRAPRGGDSELVAAGYCDHSGEYAWDELKEYIQQFEIGKGMPLPGRCVGVDCGYAEKFHREVLQKCHETGTQYKWHDPAIKTRPLSFFKNARHQFCVQVQSDGWFAMRGKPSNKPLGDGKYNHELNTNVEDPYFGTGKAGSVLVEVLEFPAGLFWNHKHNLREKRTKNTYSISPKVEFFPKIYTLDGTNTGDSNFNLGLYQRHVNEQYYNDKTGKVEPRHGRGGAQSRAHPFHLDDCENENLALATYNEFFDSNPAKT